MALIGRLSKPASLILGPVLALTVGACLAQAPRSPVPVGAPASDVYSEFGREPVHAVACDRVTWFPGDSQFDECLTRSDHIVIFRRGDFQYAYTISDGLVRDLLITNHTITWP